MTDHPRSDMDLAINHRPYPSVATGTLGHPTHSDIFGASTHSLIKHQPLFPHIVIAHADSLLPDPVVAKFVRTLDLLLPHAHLPSCLH